MKGIRLVEILPAIRRALARLTGCDGDKLPTNLVLCRRRVWTRLWTQRVFRQVDAFVHLYLTPLARDLVRGFIGLTMRLLEVWH